MAPSIKGLMTLMGLQNLGRITWYPAKKQLKVVLENGSVLQWLMINIEATRNLSQSSSFNRWNPRELLDKVPFVAPK